MSFDKKSSKIFQLLKKKLNGEKYMKMIVYIFKFVILFV